MWSFLKHFEGAQPRKRKPVAATTNESVSQNEKCAKYEKECRPDRTLSFVHLIKAGSQDCPFVFFFRGKFRSCTISVGPAENSKSPVNHTHVSAVYLVHLQNVIEEVILRWYAIPKHFLIQIHACIKVDMPQPSALTCNDLYYWL